MASVKIGNFLAMASALASMIPLIALENAIMRQYTECAEKPA